jgi:hypothetical protein
MSQGNMPDLSGLPAEIRHKLETQLAAMSPEMRAHFLRNGLPQLLQRLMTKAERATGAGTGHAGSGGAGNRHGTAPPDIRKIGAALVNELTQGRRKPHGHYNETIRPGDHPGSGRWMLFVVFAGFILTLVFH